eukprot:936060-Pleurochrysis_carterae.AAC.1
MHEVPSSADVASLSALKQMLRKCDCRATAKERTIRAHEPYKGLLYPCDCCSFGHDDMARDAEYDAFSNKLKALRNAADTADGKKDLSNFMSKHKREHRGTRPGPTGVPFTSAGLERWVVDLLHVDLNLGKLTWKWALTRLLPGASTHPPLAPLLPP